MEFEIIRRTNIQKIVWNISKTEIIRRISNKKIVWNILETETTSFYTYNYFYGTLWNLKQFKSLK